MKRCVLSLCLAMGMSGAAVNAQPYETCSLASNGTTIGPGSYAISTIGVAANSTFPDCIGDTTPCPDLWFLYHATVTGVVTVSSADCLGGATPIQSCMATAYSTCGGTVLDETCDLCESSGDPLSFGVVNGQNYLVRIGDYSFFDPSYAGTATLQFTETPAPQNDSCSTATTINGPGTTNVVFAGATTDGTLLDCANIGQSGTNDVWFNYVAGATGNAIIEFRNQDSALTVGVFDECNGTAVGCDAQGTPNRVGIHVSAGEDYYIRVALTNGNTAPRVMTISEYPKPNNDDCSGATTIGLGTTNWNNTGAIESPDELAHGFDCVASNEENASVWYKFTPATSGTAIIQADAINPDNEDPVIAAYDGCNGNSLACDDNIGSFSNRAAGAYIAVPVTSGSSIYIRLGVMTQSNNTNYFSNGTLNISIVAPLVNDECSGAITIAPGETVIDNHNAVNGSVEFTQCAFTSPSTKDIWYKWTPNVSGPAVISTCGSFNPDPMFVNRNTILSVYQNSCGVFEDFICNSNDQESHDPPCSTANSGSSNSYVEFSASAGQIYYIRVASEDAQNFGQAKLTLVFDSGCPADFNHDHVRDVADLFGYINAWLTKTPNANFNNDATVDVADLFGFINAWLAGC